MSGIRTFQSLVDSERQGGTRGVRESHGRRRGRLCGQLTAGSDAVRVSSRRHASIGDAFIGRDDLAKRNTMRIEQPGQQPGFLHSMFGVFDSRQSLRMNQNHGHLPPAILIGFQPDRAGQLHFSPGNTSTLRAPPESRQQRQICESKAGHRSVSQLRAVGPLVAVSQLWTAVTSQQACQPASTAFISRHPSGAPGVASPNGCQPTKAG